MISGLTDMLVQYYSVNIILYNPINYKNEKFAYFRISNNLSKSPSKCKKSFSRHKSAKRIYKEYNKRKVSVVNNLHYISVRYY